MQDRPSAPTLVGAVQEFLQQEILPLLHDPRLRFRVLIAANVLGVVARELAGEEDRLRAEWRLLAALAGAEDAAEPATLAGLRADVEARRRILCRRIRAGEADAGPWSAEVRAYARWAVREKLAVSNPGYLARSEGPRPDLGRRTLADG